MPNHIGDCRSYYRAPVLAPANGTARSRVLAMIFQGVLLTLFALEGQPQATAQPPTSDAKSSPPELSLESIYHPQKRHRYTSSLPTTRWITDGEKSHLLVKRESGWMQRDLDSGQETTWPVRDQLAERIAALDGVSADRAGKIADAAVRQIKRPTDAVIVSIDQSLAIVSAEEPARWLTRDASEWSNVTLDPAGRRIAYTSNHDLYLLDHATARTFRITQDGSETRLNGILDWTYQEEIYGRGNYKGFWFSPDGQWLAMLRIDISGIQPYTLPSASDQRGKGVVRRYPKAGDPIPHAELLLWDLREIDQGRLPAPKRLARSTPHEERIVTGVWWHQHQGSLIFSISDRTQTWRELRSAGASFLAGQQDQTTVLMREESPAWVEPPAAPGWLPDGSFVWRSELPAGHNRLYHISPDASMVSAISPEDFEVHDFDVFENQPYLVVTGDVQGGCVERHAYRIELAAASDQPATLQPLTTGSGWHSTTVSPDGRYLVDSFSTASSPAELFVVALEDLENTPSPISLARSTLKVPGELIEPEILRIETGDGTLLPAMVIKPSGASAQQTCPVIIETYGGPQAPVVANRWAGTKSLYRQLLARRGIATLVVDNRSSAGRSAAETWTIKGRVGEVECQDLLCAVEWLKAQPWVDGKRVALRGWSFGGFLTLYAMTHSEEFAAGIAGGSVTEWNEYDAFYTERFMGLPQENPEGYRSTSPLAAAAKLHGRVLLIHGEADDNVHPSGTYRMVDALQKAGKQFDLMIYPGAAHHVHHPGQAWHMIELTDRFLLRELLPQAR